VNGKSIKATETTKKNQCVYDLTGKGVYYYRKYRKTEPKENKNATLNN